MKLPWKSVEKHRKSPWKNVNKCVKIHWKSVFSFVFLSYIQRNIVPLRQQQKLRDD